MQSTGLLAALALTAGVAGASAITGVAHAAGPVGEPVSSTAASSWQTNATVWGIANTGGTVYLGGEFTSLKSPGAGSSTLAASHIAALDIATGTPVSGFGATANGTVYSIAASGSTLYLAGSFTQIDGQPRAYLAAVNATTGALLPWKPSVNATVLDLAVSPAGTTVYVAGNFTKSGTAIRDRAAAFDTSAALTSYAPDLNASAATIGVSPDGGHVLVGGYFSVANGQAQQAVVSTDPTTGASDPAFPNIIPNRSGCTSAVKDITFSGSAAYIAAEGTGGGCFDGDFAVDLSTNRVLWHNDCLGATQSIAVVNGLLYKGSHAHDCDFGPAGFPQVKNSTLWVTHRLLAQNLTDGGLDHWTPDTNVYYKASGKAGLGPRTMDTDGTNLFLGGDFSTVNNLPQAGFAIFRGTDTTAPVRPGTPTATSSAAGTVDVSIPGTYDKDDGTLTYNVYRDGVLIGSTSDRSWPWALPVVQFHDAALTPGSTHVYKVSAADPDGNTSAQSTASARVTVASADPASYSSNVLADSPSFYWPLDDASTTASDSSGNNDNGTFTGGYTQGQPGDGSGGSSVALNGTDGAIHETAAHQGPDTFSAEAWFRTTSTTGGKIIGFGDQPTGSSGNYDRHIFMQNDGQLTFGVWTGTTSTITSPNAYNDGVWHQVIATIGSTGMALYVDGRPAGTNTNTAAQAFGGYWRVGGDNLNGWGDLNWSNSMGLTSPNSFYFAGNVDDVAVYPGVLSSDRIAAHYAAGTHGH